MHTARSLQVYATDRHGRHVDDTSITAIPTLRSMAARTVPTRTPSSAVDTVGNATLIGSRLTGPSTRGADVAIGDASLTATRSEHGQPELHVRRRPRPRDRTSKCSVDGGSFTTARRRSRSRSTGPHLRGRGRAMRRRVQRDANDPPRTPGTSTARRSHRSATIGDEPAVEVPPTACPSSRYRSSDADGRDVRVLARRGLVRRPAPSGGTRSRQLGPPTVSHVRGEGDRPRLEPSRRLASYTWAVDTTPPRHPGSFTERGPALRASCRSSSSTRPRMRAHAGSISYRLYRDGVVHGRVRSRISDHRLVDGHGHARPTAATPTRFAPQTRSGMRAPTRPACRSRSTRDRRRFPATCTRPRR